MFEHINPKSIHAFFDAVREGLMVPDIIAKDRLETCNKCEYKKIDKFKHPFCGLCGCNVSNDKSRILNLAKYVEKLPRWGCKHPLRKDGKGWRDTSFNLVS